MIKKICLAGVVLLSAAGMVQAADVSLPSTYDWSGPYMGLQAGYGWQSNNDLDEITTATGVLNQHFVADDEGFLAGIQAGYNLVSGNFLYGIEGDLDYSAIKSDGLDFGTDELDKSIDWLGSVRARAGLTVDRALIYATGGLAFGDVSMEATDSVITISDRELAFGWTVGAGMEYAVTENLSAGIEYRYTDLANTENTGDIFGDVFTYDHENRFQAVRAVLNLHF